MDSAVMDKLRMLGLDTTLRPQIKMKRMSRVYFSVPSSPSEQLFAFVSVAAWLARRSGADLEQPREEDDPNSTIAGIVEVLRSRGVNVDFSTHKLKQGYGPEVLFILNTLADDVLKAEGFKWEQPVVTDVSDDHNNVEDPDQVEDETEIMLDKLGDEIDIYSEESEEEGYPANNAEDTATKPGERYDVERWRLELERVAPALRLKITSDGLDWRSRHAQMKTYRDELVSRYSTHGPQLSKLRATITSCLDKMAARETILNQQFAPIIKEYGSLMEELNKVTAENEELAGLISEHQETLNELNAKVEAVKHKTESRGSSMNDNSPLVNAKKAVASLKKEIQDLDFQILVLLWLLTTKDSPNVGISTLDSRVATAETY